MIFALLIFKFRDLTETIVQSLSNFIMDYYCRFCAVRFEILQFVSHLFVLFYLN